MNKSQNTVDTKLYRQTIGVFGTGVSVMTTLDDSGKLLGMTANAVTSVSLEPTLMLVCVGKKAECAGPLKNGAGFTVSFLAEEQDELSNYFAKIWDKDDPPPAFSFETWDSAAPRLADCIGAIGCRPYRVDDGGDHWIVIGEVDALWRPEEPGQPLIFYNGLYRKLKSVFD